jgi:hypothetical protein
MNDNKPVPDEVKKLCSQIVDWNASHIIGSFEALTEKP